MATIISNFKKLWLKVATITSNFEKLWLKVATITRVMMSKSVDDVRTGQPVEVERTAFIAFIEKEQVRKAPCFCIFSSF